MKKIVILFVLFTQNLYSQEIFNLIYVDNNKTLNQFETILSELDKIIDDSFLLFISDGEYPKIITNRDDYQDKIRQILLTQSERPSLIMDIKYLNNQINKFYNDIITLGLGAEKDTKINMYFFSDMKTFCGYDIHQDFVNNLLLFYNLRDRNGIKSNCNINYFIHNNFDKCSLPNDNQISIKIY